MSEALAVFLFAASIFLLYLFLKTGKRYIIFLLGLGYGYLTLVRPVFELYPLLLLLVSFYFLKNRNYKNFANFWIFFISFLLVIAPYSYRNYRKFGSVKLSAAGTLALYWGLTHKPIDLSQFNNGNPINYGALASSDKIKSIDKALFKDTLDSIKKHPFKTSLNYLKNIERLLFYSPFNKEEPLSLQRKILSLLNILSFIAMFSGLCFIIIKRVGVERVSGSILFFCYSMLFYYVFISGFLVTNPRYGLYPVFLIYLLSPVILKFYKPKIRH
jgi:4-amino-4-deoxy-L-arabinose transferase-like glycosyltransferase